jgi:hypothetical protein
MHGRMSAQIGLIVLFANALVVRVLAIVLLFDAAHAPYAYEHGEIASNLIAGQGFSISFLGAEGATSQQAPLYPLLLAAIYAALGAGTTPSLIAIQGLQAIVGAVTAALLVKLCWSLLPDRPEVGWIAGIIAALNPIQIYAVLHVQVAVWATFAVVITFVVATSTLRDGVRLPLAGVLSGGTLLFEPILVLAVPAVGCCLWRERSPAHSAANLRSRLQSLAVYVMFVLATIAPWLWRNYAVHGELVFVKSTFGYAFWQGNNAASLGTDKIPKPTVEAIRRTHDGTLEGVHQALNEARHETLYIDDVVLTAEDKAQLSLLSEPARSRSLMRRALGELSLGRYLKLCGQRCRYFLTFDATNPKAAHPVYRVATVAWLVSVVAGIVVLRGEWRALWPLAAVFVLVAMFHTLTITAPRFRIPVETVTYVWSAAPLAVVWRRMAGRDSSKMATIVDLPPHRAGADVAFRQHRRRPRRTLETA